MKLIDIHRKRPIYSVLREMESNITLRLFGIKQTPPRMPRMPRMSDPITFSNDAINIQQLNTLVIKVNKKRTLDQLQFN